MMRKEKRVNKEEEEEEGWGVLEPRPRGGEGEWVGIGEVLCGGW